MLLGSNRLFIYAVFLSVALHAMGFVLTGHLFKLTGKPEVLELKNEIILTEVLPPADNPVTTPVTKNQPASQAAPPAPTAEAWAFAGRYTLRNSKGYRYNWGQQVRSMMGTAVDGPDQGLVRFRLEIAPDGTLAKLETLWTTSAAAERLAREAIRNLPPLPPTPTGKPLIFDRTISFLSDTTESPPTYKDDCDPVPPAFESPYTWDGKAPWVPPKPKPVVKPDPWAMEECLKQLPQDTIEAELGRNEDLYGRWGTRESER